MPPFDPSRAVDQFVAEYPEMVGTHVTYRHVFGEMGPRPLFDYEGSKALLVWLLRKAKKHPVAAYLAWEMCEGTRELRRRYRPELSAEDGILQVLEARARTISRRHFPGLDVSHRSIDPDVYEFPTMSREDEGMA